MDKVLVTGGCGFLGSHLVDALLAQGYQVRVVDDLSLYGKLPKYFNTNAELFIGDVRDESLMETAIIDTDYVYHLAAHQGYSEDFSKFIDVNVKSTALIYEIINREQFPVKKVILASSQAVYGSSHSAKETDFVYPLSMYGLSKLMMERIGALIGKPDTVVLRFGIMQGARQSHGILVNFCNQDTWTIYGDGNQIRDYLHIQDAVKACLMVKDLPFGAYNVSGRAGYNVWEYMEMLTEVNLYKPAIVSKPRQYEARDATSNCEKLKGYGWRTEYTVREAIADYITYRKQYPNLKAVS